LGDEEAAVWAAAEAALLARPALAVVHLVRDARAVVESRLGVSAYCGEFIVRGSQLRRQQGAVRGDLASSLEREMRAHPPCV